MASPRMHSSLLAPLLILLAVMGRPCACSRLLVATAPSGSSGTAPAPAPATNKPQATSSSKQQAVSIQDVIPKVLKGAAAIKVTFPGMPQPLAPGQALRLSAIAQQPTVSFDGAPGKLYTLLIVDPDAPLPSNPVAAQFVHWWVSNIPGTGPATGTAKGDVIASYMAPAPPGGTHRYVIALFEQPAGLRLPKTPLASVDARVGFDAAKWAGRLGMPAATAATFFTATAGQ